MRKPTPSQLGFDLFDPPPAAVVAPPAPAVAAAAPSDRDHRHPADGQLSARALFARYLERWGGRAFAFTGGGAR